MVESTLIDALNFNARNLAIRWKEKIRKAEQLKHYNALDDKALIDMNSALYSLVARTIDRGLDRSGVGNFFVVLGKEQMRHNFPVSETLYGISLAEQIVIEYIMSDFVHDNPMQMYAAIGVVSKVAEFFVLGCFYTTKGFLEETYTHMNKKDAVSETLLKKYFKDDFFFKDNELS
ncbi:MAG: hypothetical protein LBG90_07090 [Spirochaetaceae bacterium]|jgi:hypothetical protein|nr:hypothetical protein [Spirochaetaceae bacterium]